MCIYVRLVIFFEHFFDAISITLSFPFVVSLVYTRMSGGDPAYHHPGRGYPTGGGGAASNESSFNAGELSTSLSSSGTSGIASGEGTDCSGGGSALQQRLVAAGVGVSREQGVRDLRSIIQYVPVDRLVGECLVLAAPVWVFGCVGFVFPKARARRFIQEYSN